MEINIWLIKTHSSDYIKQMNHKILGKSQIKISSLGLGTGTGLRYIDKKRDKELIYVLHKAVDLGVNIFDSAEVYFNGHAEELIGKAFNKNRERVIIATKFLPEHSNYKKVLKAAEGSLKRLQTDYIDLYQIHWPNSFVPIEETLKALEKLVNDGKIRYIGVCNFSFRQLKAIQKASRVPITSLQTEYNLLERSIENDLLPYCEKNNITVIAYTPLNSGNILHKAEYSRILLKIFKKYGKSASQIILNFLVSHQPVIAIPATTNIIHLKENTESTDFIIEQKDLELLSKTFTTKIVKIDIKKIRIATFSDHAAYQTVKEAIDNKLNFFPSPEMLSKDLQNGDFLKPVKVKKIQKSNFFEYELVGGRIRFWAWVIAFNGKKSIPAIIED